jgi:hypothetical protein
MSAKPTPFKRGQTFSFLLEIPAEIDDGALNSWKPTAQLRRERDNTPTGKIADMNCFWADPGINRYLTVYHNNTGSWPLGLAEFDVLLTSSDGQQLRSTTALFDIQRGITK